MPRKSIHFDADEAQLKEEEEKRKTKERLFMTATAKNLKTVHKKSFETINNALRKQSIKVGEARSVSASVTNRNES